MLFSFSQQEHFFSDIDLILPEIKKIKLYNQEEHNLITKQNSTWPGYRSMPLIKTNPILWQYVNELLFNKKIIAKGGWKIFSCIHLRLKKNKIEDWIHKDEADGQYDSTCLIYLSDTNLESGTRLYDDNKNLINDIKFVKNRAIIFSGNYNHMGYGHYGDSIDNGRLTLNIFLKKIK